MLRLHGWSEALARLTIAKRTTRSRAADGTYPIMRSKFVILDSYHEQIARSLPGAGETFRVECHANRASWLAARRTGIGGSDAPALWRKEIERAGGTTFGSEYSLWAEKRGLVPSIDETDVEPVIAALYERRSGNRVIYPGPFTLLRSIRWPFMIVTLDRAIETSVSMGVLECKSAAAEWKDTAPLAVACQVQHALLVTGWTWGVAADLVCGRFVCQDIDRDESFLTTHLLACSAFWGWRVMGGRAPPIDGDETTQADGALTEAVPPPEVKP